MMTMRQMMETAVLPNVPMIEPANAGTPKAALWVCEQCQVWWGSQNGHQQEARYLLRLAEPNSPLFKWEDYRGWREKTINAHVCLECGQEVANPRFALLEQANGRGV